MENRYKILIVDDNPKNIQVLGNILQRNNFDVEYAQNGRNALEWVYAENFDLILLDIMMPEMDGFEVCKTIRKDKRFSNTPIIFLSAKSDKKTVVKGFNLNAQDYINKPFDTSELLARINTQIELKVTRDKLRRYNKDLKGEVDRKTKDLSNLNIKLEESLVEIKNLDKMKTYFLNMTSNELRTPLTGILGIMHLLKNHEASSTLKELIDLLEKSVNRLERFTQKAILTAELSSDTYDLKMEDLHIYNITQYILLELNDKINRKNINIINNFKKTTSISGNKELIYDALYFILENAIHHSGKEGTIECVSEESESSILYTIKDSGEGFSTEILSRIFLPYTFNEKALHKGNNMNFYLLNLIIEKHNGKLIIDNSTKGASVQFKFFKT